MPSIRSFTALCLVLATAALAPACSNSTTPPAGMCADVGEACTAAEDCCDGNNCNLDGLCEPAFVCGAEGDACTDDAECCDGLCDSGVCAASVCAIDGEPCAVDSDCCESFCDVDGLCGPGAPVCAVDGDACAGDGDCCSGLCDAGTCGTGAACVPCGTAIMGDPNPVCAGPSSDLYDALGACACAGACTDVCAGNLCASSDMTDECRTCLLDTVAGCGTELNACANDV